MSGPSKDQPMSQNITDALEGELKPRTKKGLLDPYAVIPLSSNPGAFKHDGFSAYRRWWCVDEDLDFRSVAREFVDAYCKSTGGNVDGDWCMMTRDVPIFGVRVGGAHIVDPTGQWCTSGKNVGVVAISAEDTWDRSTAEWLELIKTQYGYKTKAEAAELRRQIDERKRKQHEERLIRGRQIVAAGVGAQVCSQQGRVVYIGFVDEVANGKIRVAVSDAQVSGRPGLAPGGFQSSIIWDQPENWYMCR